MVLDTAMRDLFLGFAAALLPAPERDEFAHRHGVDPAGWSGLLGLTEFLGGGAALVSNGLAFFQRVAERNATIFVNLMENQELTDAEKVSYGLSGVAIWVQWMTRPWTWFLFMLPAVGVVRMVTWWVNSEASGEPLVWAGLRLSQLMKRKAGESRVRRRFGPERPDRVIAGPDGGVTVLSCRPKPDWNPRVTIELDRRFYRLLKTEERQDGAWWMYAHVLGEQPENEIIRALIRYR
jgi:hypothetical protein